MTRLGITFGLLMISFFCFSQKKMELFLNEGFKIADVKEVFFCINEIKVDCLKESSKDSFMSIKKDLSKETEGLIKLFVELKCGKKYCFFIEKKDYEECNDLTLNIIKVNRFKNQIKYDYLVCGSYGVLSDKGIVYRQTKTK